MSWLDILLPVPVARCILRLHCDKASPITPFGNMLACLEVDLHAYINFCRDNISFRGLLGVHGFRCT